MLYSKSDSEDFFESHPFWLGRNFLLDPSFLVLDIARRILCLNRAYPHDIQAGPQSLQSSLQERNRGKIKKSARFSSFVVTFNLNFEEITNPLEFVEFKSTGRYFSSEEEPMLLGDVVERRSSVKFQDEDKPLHTSSLKRKNNNNNRP